MPDKTELVKKLQALTFLQGTVLSRISHFGRLGYQFEGDRNIYQALGYKLDLDFLDYYSQYQRQDIAKAVVDTPIRTTWRGEINLLESSDDEVTPLEKEWDGLNKQFGFRSVFARLDRLVSLNHYGILLLGLDDTKDREVFRTPVKGGKRKLLYLKPFGEESATILEWDQDTSSPRYGYPILYQVSVTTPDGGGSQDIPVHFSRVIHVPGEELLDNELSGAPKLEVVFNRLKDLEKLVGGSAEMFWRGARPGYQGKVDPDYQMTTDTEADLQDQIDEYEHNLRRIMVNQGVDLQALASQVADPSSHVDIQLQMISAVTGIPKRILTGSERGELASTQDRDNWFDRIQSRREEYCEPLMVRPFVNRCIEIGVLPPLKKGEEDYTVEWTSLYAQSEMDMANLGKTRAETLKSYASAPTNQDIIPPDAFLRLMLNLTDEEIELIESQQEAMAKEEAEDMKEEEVTEEKVEENPEEKEEATKEEPLTQVEKDRVDWKDVYAQEGAHWMTDLQPSLLAQEFASELVDAGKKSILEIGCASGKDSILFSLAGLEVTGVDLVPKAIKLAKKNAKRAGALKITFQTGNVESLTFPDNHFDSVFSVSVLHSTDLEKSVAEIARVLKRSGLGLIHLYSDVQTITGETIKFILVDEWITFLKEQGFLISDIYTTQDEEFDEAGEKHSIIVTRVIKE